MWASEIPASFADVVAPMRKLCVLHWEAFIFIFCRMVLSLELNICVVSCLPSSAINSDSACAPCIARYGFIAFTGHILVPILPRNRSTP